MTLLKSSNFINLKSRFWLPIFVGGKVMRYESIWSAILSLRSIGNSLQRSVVGNDYPVRLFIERSNIAPLIRFLAKVFTYSLLLLVSRRSSDNAFTVTEAEASEK